jgi:hypothetical protein
MRAVCMRVIVTGVGMRSVVPAPEVDDYVR